MSSRALDPERIPATIGRLRVRIRGRLPDASRSRIAADLLRSPTGDGVEA